MTADEIVRHELLNQALKGLLAGLGHGSGATRKGSPISLRSPVEIGDDLVRPELLEAMAGRPPGSYLVVASKVVSLAERRVITIPRNPLPPRRAPEVLLERLRMVAITQGTEVTVRDAIGADLLDDDGEHLTFALLPSNPNRSAHELAAAIWRETSVSCDVIVTDTSAGWAKGVDLIGIPTFLATPIGLTGGCDLYYAQRLAATAEVIRNEVPLTPFVVVDPPTDRSRLRDRTGTFVGDGFFDSKGTEVYLDRSRP
ncbi:coenzyme F420-0:L-glutamate ligase [Kribbella sp. CWNU-51]